MWPWVEGWGEEEVLGRWGRGLCLPACLNCEKKLNIFSSCEDGLGWSVVEVGVTPSGREAGDAGHPTRTRVLDSRQGAW